MIGIEHLDRADGQALIDASLRLLKEATGSEPLDFIVVGVPHSLGVRTLGVVAQTLADEYCDGVITDGRRLLAMGDEHG
jgi:hypothetical protein